MKREALLEAGADRVRDVRKELTYALLSFFLDAVVLDGVSPWRDFTAGLDRILLEESLRLSGGNGRKAAALAGLPYQTFMTRVQKLKNGKSVPPVGCGPREETRLED
jgi:hypothetical protein